MSYLYIASPYTHPDPAMMQMRYEKAIDFTSFLIADRGMHVLSPIVHSHPLCTHRNLRPEYDFWMEYDKELIRASRGIIVLQIDGWQESKGVKAEMDFATVIGKPISFSREDFPRYDHKI